MSQDLYLDSGMLRVAIKTIVKCMDVRINVRVAVTNSVIKASSSDCVACTGLVR